MQPHFIKQMQISTTMFWIIYLTNKSTFMISTDNRLKDILDFDLCKKLVEDADAKEEEIVILCPHYSINIAMKYDDGEALQFDLDELSDHIGHMVEVSDFDDLIVDLMIYED